MNELIKIEERDGSFYTTSLNVAEVTGKQHFHVIRTIRQMIEERPELGRSRFRPSSYINSQNRSMPMYEIDRRLAEKMMFGMKRTKQPTKVYFVTDGNGNVKIGTASDVEKRLRTLQIGNAYKLKVLKIIKGGQALERSLHKKFESYSIGNEWFKLTDEIKDFIKTNAKGELKDNERTN